MLIAGRYEVRELLGEGGMGLVYRAVDTRTGGLVAIKTMRDASDPRMIEMFRKEWKVLARLSCANIVDIRDVDEMEENGVRKPCYVMPLLAGATLATLIKESGHRLTVERVVNLLGQVSSGLEVAHKAGLIHRDLKPSNIFVMEDGTAKLIDFGLVYSADARSVTGHKGTWQYMAPEQTEGKSPTIQSDIFSLGVVAYEAFTGRKPFAKTTVEATVEAIRNASPPAISEINPKVTQLLSKVVHKAMAKQPLHRYASAHEFSETLQKAFRNQPIDRFAADRIRPRIERARNAFQKGDCAFASEILSELEAEGNVDPEITLLRAQIEEAVKQKRIRHLFEGAQTRLEQDEVPLALDKLREILELDPENSEALAMRKRIEEERNSRQISDWLNLARQHLKLQDFGEARQALKEVLNIRYDDSDALALLAEVDLREREASKARAEKEQLYGSALRAYQGGEISTALSKLEKILDVSRRTPGAAIPERDAVYQSFYNRVRSERDTIDNAYEEGRRLLNEKEFQKALEVCNQMLAQYPASAQFHALKLRVEQSERQELSAYIAEIARSVDAEPNLDRRVNLLEEACRRYPQEPQFQQSLRLAREQRDLVHSIATKAHQYEEQGQFADAIGQWKILRNIHPQYPGVEMEIAQLEKRREQQGQEEKKQRFIEQIDHAVENGAYKNAVRLAGEALAEFPQDSELLVLQRIARQNLERTEEAERLFDEARRLRAAGQFENATAQMEHALALDEHNAGMRNALVSLLVERANLLLEKDRRLAEPLAEQAYQLDAQHPGLKRLRARINEAKRKDYVTQCVAEARELHVAGDVAAASACLSRGLVEYPDEIRLMQCQATLLRESRPEPARPLGPKVPAREPVQAPTGITGLFNRSESIPVSLAGSEIEPAGATSVQAPPEPPLPVPPPASSPKPPHRVPMTWVFAAICLVLLMAIGLFFAMHRNRPNKAGSYLPPVARVDVPLTISPSGARVVVDGQLQTASLLHLEANKTYTVSAAKPGYKAFGPKALGADAKGWNISLEPEPLRIQVLTSERSGRILLDGRETWKLEQGDLTDLTVAADGAIHTLSARNDIGELFRVVFHASPGEVPVVEPVSGSALVASGLANHARLYSATPGTSVSAAGVASVPLSKQGEAIDLKGSEPDQATLNITAGDKRETILFPHGDAPVLLVSLNANPNLGSLTLTANVEGAKLFFDGHERKTRKPGYWHIAATAGAHEVRLTADGYADEVRMVQIAKGQDQKQSIEMTGASAQLAIRGGISGTEVSIDGKPAGMLDADGSLQVTVAPGEHQIVFRKAGFDELSSVRSFEGGKTITLEGKDATVRLLATINFAATPAFTTIRYRRVDEAEWHAGAPGSSARVKAGKYQVAGEATGYISSQIDVQVASGQVVRAELKLVASPTGGGKTVVRRSSLKDAFVRPGDVDDQKIGGWLTGYDSRFLDVRHKDKYELVFLTAAQKGGLFHRAKHMEWRVSAPAQDKSPAAEVAYELDSNQLTRKVRIDGKVVAKWSGPASVADGPSALSVNVSPDGQSVRVTNSKGAMLDQFNDPRFDWAHAQVSIRGDSFFIVR